MLIVPMTGKLSWRNPPWITLLLILVNCFVFFEIQGQDDEKQIKAIRFYVESGLGEIETGRYIDYLKAQNREAEIKLPTKINRKDPEVILYLRHSMMEDDGFMERLDSGQIITSTDPAYSRWSELKKDYRDKASEIVSERYGYKPATSGILDAFTYMFLHGGTAHLIGNMIFLWLVGCSLELACNRPAYFLVYLLTGVLSAIGFGTIYKSSGIPLVGASGAISGIIGAYTVLFGRTKVKIFYTLGFFFSYSRVSAIFLLPVWIGNELFQLYFGGVSNVAYVAHISGLVSGASLGFVQSKLLGGIRNDTMGDDRAQKMASLIEQGLQKFSELDYKGARALIHEALTIDPNSRMALSHLFNIEKLNPGSDEFHSAAMQLLLYLHRDECNHEALLNTYKEYCRCAQQPRLSPDLCARLSSAFSQQGYLDESEKIIAILLQKSPQYPAVPTVLLNLSQAHLKSGKQDRAEKCLRLLCQRYPHSAESGIAQGLLKQTA